MNILPSDASVSAGLAKPLPAPGPTDVIESQPPVSGGWLRFCVLAYCGWQAGDLLVAWRSNSPEATAWLAFGLWLIPALPLGVFRRSLGRPQTGLLASALVLSCLGQLTWLNCSRHAGLALALAGWKRPVRGQLGWLLASLLWMPVCGWLSSGLLAGWEAWLRIALTALTVVWVAWRNREPGRAGHCSAAAGPAVSLDRFAGAAVATLLCTVFGVGIVEVGGHRLTGLHPTGPEADSIRSLGS